MNKSLSSSPSLSLLSTSISTSHTHTHRCTQGHPTNTHHGTIPYTRLLLLMKHVCRMCNPLSPHFQSTGKAYSPFVYADMSRRQVAGLQTDGLKLSFLPFSLLPPTFSQECPLHACTCSGARALAETKHLSPCFRDVFTCSPVTNKLVLVFHNAAFQAPLS